MDQSFSDDDIPLFSPEFLAHQASKSAKRSKEQDSAYKSHPRVQRPSALDRGVEQALAGSGSLQLINIAPERNMDFKLEKLIQRVTTNTGINSLELQVPLCHAAFIKGSLIDLCCTGQSTREK